MEQPVSNIYLLLFGSVGYAVIAQFGIFESVILRIAVIASAWLEVFSNGLVVFCIAEKVVVLISSTVLSSFEAEVSF